MEPMGNVFADEFGRNPGDTANAAEQKNPLELQVVDVLRTCYDPEIPVDIYELGLIYNVDGDVATGDVKILMTLTSPMCPVAESLPLEVEEKVRNIAEVKNVKVDITWEPPWNPAMMSEGARLELGFF